MTFHARLVRFAAIIAPSVIASAMGWRVGAFCGGCSILGYLSGMLSAERQGR